MDNKNIESKQLISLAVRISARYPRAHEFIEAATNFSAKHSGTSGKRPTLNLLSNLHSEALAAAEHDGQAGFFLYVRAEADRKAERLAADEHLQKLRTHVKNLASNFSNTSLSQTPALIEALRLHMKQQRPLARVRPSRPRPLPSLLP